MQISTKTKKQLELLLYKFLYDLLFLWLAIFFLLLVSESILPTFLSSHLSLTKAVIILAILMVVIAYLGKRNNITYELPKGKEIITNKFVILLLLIVIALIVIAQRGMAIFEIVITTIVTAVIFFLLYDTLFLEE